MTNYPTYPVSILVDQISTSEKFTVTCNSEQEVERAMLVIESNEDLVLVEFLND